MNRTEGKNEKRNPIFKITAIILAAFFLFFGLKSYAGEYKKVPAANHKLYKR